MQPADLEEVVKKGVQTVVIGRGMSEALQVGFHSGFVFPPLLFRGKKIHGDLPRGEKKFRLLT